MEGQEQELRPINCRSAQNRSVCCARFPTLTYNARDTRCLSWAGKEEDVAAGSGGIVCYGSAQCHMEGQAVSPATTIPAACVVSGQPEDSQ